MRGCCFGGRFGGGVVSKVVTLGLTKEQAETLSGDISEIICFLHGFRAGRKGDVDESAFISLNMLRELNIKLKQEVST